MAQDEGLNQSLTPYADPKAGSMEAFKLGELEAGIGPATTWDKYKAAMELAIADSPIGVLGLGADDLINGTWTRAVGQWSMNRQFEAEGRSKASADDLNKRFPGMPKPFTDDEYPEIAQLKWDENERKNKYREYIRRGGGLNFAEEMLTGAPTMLDPVNLLSSMATAGAAKFLGVGKSIATNFAENAIGNLAVDVPTYYMQKSEGQDPSIEATVFGSLGGAALGTALHAGISAAIAKGKKILNRMPEKLKEDGVRTAVAQLEIGKNVDTKPLTDVHDRRLVADPSTQSEPGTVYAAHDPEGNNVSLMDHGDEGLHVTDDPNVANNMAANPEELPTGSVVKYQIDENAKFLNLDSPVSKDLMTNLESKLGPEFFKKLNITEKTTISELMDQIVTLGGEGPKQVEISAKEIGFSGYETKADGKSAKYLFDREQATPVAEMMGDKSTVPQMTPDERANFAEQTLAPENNRHYDPKVIDEINKVVADKASLEAKQVEMERAVESYADRVIRAHQEEKIDPRIEHDLKTINEEMKLIKDQETALKAFADCVTKGSV